MFMPRAPTTPSIPFLSATPRGAWALKLPLWATPSSTRLAICWLAYAIFPMPDSNAPSFLVVRLGSLGDLVHTIPAVAALRSGFPDARIDWIVERKWMPLVALVGGVDEV